MKLHVSSFLLGTMVGAMGLVLEKRGRPVLTELATAGFRIGDSLVTSAAITYENIEDVLAEARARARGGAGGDGGERSIEHRAERSGAQQAAPQPSEDARGEQHG